MKKIVLFVAVAVSVAMFSCGVKTGHEAVASDSTLVETVDSVEVETVVDTVVAE